MNEVRAGRSSTGTARSWTRRGIIAASLQAPAATWGSPCPRERGGALRDRPQHGRHAQARRARARRRGSAAARRSAIATISSRDEHESPLFEGIRRDARRAARRAAAGWRWPPARRARASIARSTRPASRDWFEATRCADEGFAKPHPGMLLALLETTGVEAAAGADGGRHHARPRARGQRRRRRDRGDLRGAPRRAARHAAGARARARAVADLHRWLTTHALICASAALVDGGDGRALRARPRRLAVGFVVRYCGTARAYVNRCPHAGTELDWQPGEFFEESWAILDLLDSRCVVRAEQRILRRGPVPRRFPRAPRDRGARRPGDPPRKRR